MDGVRTILVFLKHPEPGRVKTRLAATVGNDRAAELYHNWIGEVLVALQPLRGSTRLIGYFDGAAKEAFAAWSHLVDDWWSQPTGDLGVRLTAGFRLALANNQPAIAVGTDCLEMDTALISGAFEQMSNYDVVFGPTPDGGYYLVGMSAERIGLFEGVRWSSPDTLSDHLTQCQQRGWSHALLPARHDIDTWGDWLAYSERTGR